MTTSSTHSHSAALDALHWDFDLGVLHAAADKLVAAVHCLDAPAVDEALEVAADDYPRPDALRALVVLLAAAVPEDAAVAEHVAWVGDPPTYARLRAAGASPAFACAALAPEPARRTSSPGGAPR